VLLSFGRERKGWRRGESRTKAEWRAVLHRRRLGKSGGPGGSREKEWLLSGRWRLPNSKGAGERDGDLGEVRAAKRGLFQGDTAENKMLGGQSGRKGGQGGGDLREPDPAKFAGDG